MVLLHSFLFILGVYIEKIIRSKTNIIKNFFSVKKTGKNIKLHQE